MKCAILHGIKDIKLEDIPIPKERTDRILIKIIACGICGTDILTYKGKIPHKFPYSFGHECCGIVQSIGEDIKNIKV